jgi:hypothetical protein
MYALGRSRAAGAPDQTAPEHLVSARKKKTPLPGRELEAVHGVDPDGRPVVHHRVVDKLARLFHAGVITSEQHRAARAFEAAFAAAGLDPLRARPLDTAAGSGCHRQQLTEGQALARRRVALAIDALGGHHSPAASCIWCVIGHQMSLRQWALRQRWGGRPVRPDQAQGVLVAALGVLATHFRNGDRRRDA